MRPVVHLLPLLLPCALPAQSGWSAPVVETTLNSTASDLHADLSFDGLTLHLASFRSNNWELYVATRASRTQPWGAPVLIPELADPAVDAGPELRTDGLELFFDSSRPGGLGGSDIWRAVRTSTSVPWGVPTPVTELNTSNAEASPSLTADGLTVFFISNRAGGPGQSDVWMAQRVNYTSPFSTPVPVPQVNSPLSDRDPEVSPDGLTLVHVTTDMTTQRSDLAVSRRTNPAGAFGAPVFITELRSPQVTLAPTLDWKQNEMLFSRLVSNTQGYDFYSTRFEGLTVESFITATSLKTLYYRDSGSPGALYVGALSLGTTPGIQIGTRTIPLNADVLFQVSLSGMPGLASNFVGLLDAGGEATATLRVPFPELNGLRFFAGFLTLDGAAPFLVKTISNAVELEVY
jgi:hypothetical protein